MKILETDRLYLRTFALADADVLFRLNADEEVLQFTGDEPFKDKEAAEQFIRDYDHYKVYGFGRWAVIRNKDDAFLGWCGVKYTPQLNEYDIGFRFFKKHWGQGYATEAARACIGYAFNELGINEIVGRAMKANPASIQVLKKIGLVGVRDFDFDGKEGVQLKINKGWN